MRSIMVALAGGVLLAGCGGSSNGGGSVVTPTPTPTPSPTPSPTPTPSYSTYAALSGNQSFKTACASLGFTGVPPMSNPATAYGDGLVLDYTAGTESYAISGDGQSLSFGPVDRDPAAPASVRAYVSTVDGFTRRFSIGQPSAGGTALDYMRGFQLYAPKNGPAVQYACVFGVPTLAGDLPTTAFNYGKASVNGVAYGADASGMRTLSLEGSTISVAYDPVARTVATTITLVGTVQTAAGPGATVQLGSYSGTATIDSTKGSYYGPITSSNREGVFAFFGGWFFGPQAREAGFTANIHATDPATGLVISAMFNAPAIR